MAVIDIFNGDAFKVRQMTNAINKLPYKPGRIGQLGIFEEQGVTTTTIALEEKGGVLTLLSSKNRGGPSNVMGPERRTLRALPIPHIPVEDTILASDVQDIREFGSDSQLQAITAVVNDRLQPMRDSVDVTIEWMMLGALKGNVVDGDGTTSLANLFTTFGVASPAAVDFVLGTGTTDIRAKCLQVQRGIEAALGGTAVYDHVHALCGPNFFERLIGHDAVKYTYAYSPDNHFLREDPRRGFDFAGITFEEYRGSVGNTAFVGPGECRFFPVGAPGLFKIVYAPGDFFETVNTTGKRMYAKQQMMEFDRGVKLHVQSNPLPYCTRPMTLWSGTTSN